MERQPMRCGDKRVLVPLLLLMPVLLPVLFVLGLFMPETWRKETTWG